MKIHLNSVISTKEVKYMIVDNKDFYYGTPMENFEYGHHLLELIPKEIIQQYILRQLAVNGKVYFEIRKDMPGLKQAGIIAHK